jgi:2-C-methyl-D-erythritol 2,4-cyclodiphosphate synthase
MKNVSIKGKTPEGLAQDSTAVAHVVVLLESIELPNEHRLLAAAADAPDEAEINGVVSSLLSDAHDISALGRKRPAFDPDDLT